MQVLLDLRSAHPKNDIYPVCILSTDNLSQKLYKVKQTLVEIIYFRFLLTQRISFTSSWTLRIAMVMTSYLGN